MAGGIPAVREQQQILLEAIDLGSDRGALFVAQGLVRALESEFAHADHDIGNRIERLVGQLQVRLGELRIAIVDFGQTLAARQCAQAGGSHRIVG